MNKTKKILAAVIAAATVLAMAGCGENETASTSNTQSTADKGTADSRVSSSKTQSEDNKETAEQTKPVTEESKAPAGKLEDRPKLTIELEGGKTFTYNSENFSDVYQQLTDLGLVTDKAKEEYEKDGVFGSGYL